MPDDPTPHDPHPQLNALETERRAKMNRIREMGLDPFGGRVDNLTSIHEARGREKSDGMPDSGQPGPKVAGRLILKSDMGKLWFVRLRDETGEIQIALDAKRLDEPTLALRKQLDLGDIVVVQGPLGTTKKGETTIWANELMIASKSLAVPPEKWSGLTDVEARSRQRYVDLAYNEGTMRQMKRRIAIVDEVRAFLRNKGFDEVETPMLQPIHGGAAARPFVTQHNALDMRLFLRIAPELYLKRLLVGGFRKVFEINRNFRNEGISPRHNPEFTMLEAYWAFANWEQMADLVEEMIAHVAQTVIGTLEIDRAPGGAGAEPAPEATHDSVGDPVKAMNVPNVPPTMPDEATPAPKTTINLTRPWRRATMAQLVEERTGWHFDKHSIAGQPHALAKALTAYDADGVNALARRAAGLQLFGEEEREADRLATFEKHLLALSPAEQLVELYSNLVEPFLLKKPTVDLTRPWDRATMAQLVEARTGWRFRQRSLFDEGDRELEKSIGRALAIRANDEFRGRDIRTTSGTPVAVRFVETGFVEGVLETFAKLSPAEQLVELYEKLVEPTLIDPCFVTRVPGVIIPLARRCRDDDYFADVYELAINGQEISPGYTELNDPDVQAEHFRHQVGDRAEQQQVDEDFLTALRYGMPPAGGIGLGIDRLVMLLTGASSIRDVILFPLMRSAN